MAENSESFRLLALAAANGGAECTLTFGQPCKRWPSPDNGSRSVFQCGCQCQHGPHQQGVCDTSFAFILRLMVSPELPGIKPSESNTSSPSSIHFRFALITPTVCLANPNLCIVICSASTSNLSKDLQRPLLIEQSLSPVQTLLTPGHAPQFRPGSASPWLSPRPIPPAPPAARASGPGSPHGPKSPR